MLSSSYRILFLFSEVLWAIMSQDLYFYLFLLFFCWTILLFIFPLFSFYVHFFFFKAFSAPSYLVISFFMFYVLMISVIKEISWNWYSSSSVPCTGLKDNIGFKFFMQETLKFSYLFFSSSVCNKLCYFSLISIISMMI